jgi:serine/threonine protein kinase
LLEREIGRGGMATVYLAHDLKHERPVALKVLRPELAANIGTERFLREIKLAARLQHPHILSVYDSGATAGHLWFTMPYIEGETLRSRLMREKQLPVEEALRITCEAAEALDSAHRRGVIHRDIKPDNILLSEGHALVADFGVAMALGVSKPGDRITDVGIAVGTPAYMSPEQAAGEPTDERSDLYSLGIVTYEMLVGEPPFTGPTAQVTMAKRLSGEVPRLRRLRPGVSEAVESLILRALAITPADRYQTGAEFARAIEEVGSGPFKAARRPWSRKRLLTASAAALVLGLAMFLPWGRDSEESGAQPRRIAVLPFVNLNEGEDEYFAEGITDEVRGKLAALPGVQVTARSSSSQYAQSTKRPQEIGKELGVEYLLTGTVRWEKGQGGRSRVRVSPELVQASTGSTQWQQPFEAPMTDVFQVQAGIAGRVASALDVALAPRQQERLAQQPTEDLDAYDLYLRGRHSFHRRTAAGLNEARGLFEQAIALDPRYARAHAGLADVYVVLPFWDDVPPRQTYPRATAAAIRALELDSTLGTAHAALADARALYEWDWPAAERGFKRSLRLDPNNANTHHWYGEDYLNVLGQGDAALREGHHARRLDPLSPVYAITLAQTLMSLGRYDEALELADDITSVDPSYSVAYETRGRVFLHTGRNSDAVKAFQRNLELSGRKAMTLALLGYAYTKAGRGGDAERVLRELQRAQQDRYASATAIAILHAGLGDTTEAFRSLERAAEERDPFLVYFFVVDPILSGLRKDARGVSLLQLMNLRPK